MADSTGLFRRSACLCALALAVLLTAGCEPPSIEAQIARAAEYQKNGESEAAALILKNVLQQEPNNGSARLMLGTILRNAGDLHGAESHLRAALEAKVDPQAVLPLLVQSLFEQAQFEKILEITVVSDYGEAVLQPDVLAYKGHAQTLLGRRDDAAASFEEALKRKPEHASALLGQARLSILNRNVKGARALIDRVLASNPQSVEAWLMKGELDRASGDGPAALADFQKAHALGPKGLAANLSLVSIYLETGKLDLARKHVGYVRQAAPESALGYYLVGLIEFQSNNLAAANDAILQVLRTTPNYLPATALAGVLAYASGANDDAEKNLREAVTRQPASLYLRKMYAAALLKSGKAQLAIETLEPVLKSGAIDHGVLALYAEAKFRTNDVKTARKYFELAAKQSPQNPGVRTRLGLARLAMGETDRALADLEAAIELGGATADTYLVRTYLSAKQLDKALDAVKRVEAKRPKDALTFNLKGAVLFARGDVPGARAAFERALVLKPAQFAASRNLAQLDVRDKDMAAARGRYEKILERDPENAPAMLALSDLAAVSNQPAEALSWAKKAKVAQPKTLGPSMALLNLYFAARDYPRAISAARDALNIAPDNAEALNMLGYSCLQVGQIGQALKAYETVAGRYPNSAEAHYGLSGALSADGQIRPAERELRLALKLRPDFPEAIYALAALQLKSGKPAEASMLAADAEGRLPKSVAMHVVAGDAAVAEKRYERAAQSYAAAFEMEPSHALLTKLYRALQSAGKARDADKLAAEWLRKNPDDVRARYLIADTALRSQNYAAAVEQYQQVLRSEPDNPRLLHNLMWAYERLNDPRALETAERAAKVAPNDAAALHDFGRLLVDAGRAQRAVEPLEKARLLAPESQVVRYQLARAYSQTGDNKKARAELAQLLRSEREFAERAAAVELLKQLKQ